MKNIRQTVFNLIFVLLLAVNSSFPATTNGKSVNKKIDTYIKTTMKQHGIPGVALAVVKKGRIIHHNYYGKSNIEHSVPVNKRTVFYLFSTTKIIVATGVFHLIDRKRITLEDPISKYVNGLPDTWKRVKIKHLLSYSSGLPQIQFEKSEKLAAQKTFKQKLEYNPGERWSYSQTNYWLLKKVIENVSQMSFEKFILETQFPAKQNVAFSSNSYEIIPNRTSIYKAENPRRKQEITLYHAEPYFHVSNGLNANLEALIGWNRNLDKGTFFTNETKSQMWTRFNYSKSKRRFTYGWDVYRINQTQSYGFTGGGVSGLRKFPSKDLTIILLSNGYKHIPIPNRIIDHVAGIVDRELVNIDGLLNEELLSNFFSNSFSKALANYKKVRQENPSANIEQTLNSIGYSFANKGKYADAIEVFKINTTEYPNSANAWDSLGEGFEMAGDKNNAIKYYKKSLELDKNNQHAKDKIKLLSSKVL